MSSEEESFLSGPRHATQDYSAPPYVPSDEAIAAFDLSGTMSGSTFAFDPSKSLRAKKLHKKGTRRHTLHKTVKVALNSGIFCLRDTVRLPEGESKEA